MTTLKNFVKTNFLHIDIDKSDASDMDIVIFPDGADRFESSEFAFWTDGRELVDFYLHPERYGDMPFGDEFILSVGYSADDNRLYLKMDC